MHHEHMGDAQTQRFGQRIINRRFVLALGRADGSKQIVEHSDTWPMKCDGDRGVS